MRALSIRPHYVTVSNDARYLSAAQIMERFGVSHMWIIRRMADADFPQPIRFSSSKTSRRFWRLDEVEAWERCQFAAHERKGVRLPSAQS
jgi:predicted DNA-binding transcriptional regulator AlpA